MSGTRSRSSWKPRIAAVDVPLYRCETCGAVFMGVSDGCGIATVEHGRAPLHELPYQRIRSIPSCCGNPMHILTARPFKEIPGFAVEARFFGGYDANALRLAWRAPEHNPFEWICVRTFSGMQIYYVPKPDPGHAVFAFAGEDAYCYCDKSPCESCTFLCKRGFMIYAYATESGLLRIDPAQPQPENPLSCKQ